MRAKMELNNEDYKEQFNIAMECLRHRRLSLVKPSWLTPRTQIIVTVFALFVTAVQSYCCIDLATRPIDVIGYARMVEGIRYSLQVRDISFSAIVTMLLSLTQFSSHDKRVYCAFPWLMWTIMGMASTELPAMFTVCDQIMQLSYVHGTILTASMTVLWYMQIVVVYLVWFKTKTDIGPPLAEFIKSS